MSSEKLIFYNVSDDYINYLRKYGDEKVLFNKPEDRTRPYVGFVLKINDMDYLVPLSSKIRKTNEVTTVIPNTFTETQKIQNEKEKKFPDKIATIKFNCMIPIFPDVIKKIDLEEIAKDEDGENYKNLLIKEIIFCSDNRDKIIKKAEKTYKIFNENKPYMRGIVESCCNFKVLEQKCKEYQLNSFDEAVATAEK